MEPSPRRRAPRGRPQPLLFPLRAGDVPGRRVHRPAPGDPGRVAGRGVPPSSGSTWTSRGGWTSSTRPGPRPSSSRPGASSSSASPSASPARTRPARGRPTRTRTRPRRPVTWGRPTRRSSANTAPRPPARTVLVVVMPGKVRKNDTVVRFFSSLPKAAVTVKELKPLYPKALRAWARPEGPGARQVADGGGQGPPARDRRPGPQAPDERAREAGRLRRGPAGDRRGRRQRGHGLAAELRGLRARRRADERRLRPGRRRPRQPLRRGRAPGDGRGPAGGLLPERPHRPGLARGEEPRRGTRSSSTSSLTSSPSRATSTRGSSRAFSPSSRACPGPASTPSSGSWPRRTPRSRPRTPTSGRSSRSS